MNKEAEEFKKEIDRFIESFGFSLIYIKDFLKEYKKEDEIPTYVFIDLKYKLLGIKQIMEKASPIIRFKPFMLEFSNFIYHLSFEFAKHVNKSDSYPDPHKDLSLLLKKFNTLFKNLRNSQSKFGVKNLGEKASEI